MTGKNTHDYLTDNDYSIFKGFEPLGGNSQEWKRENHIGENISNDIPQHGAGSVKSRHVSKSFNVNEFKPCIDNSQLIIPLHVNPIDYDSHEELYKAFIDWWTKIKGRAKKTADIRIRHARSMENHGIYPVDWFEFKPEQILNQMLYRQNIEYPNKAQETGNPTYGITQLTNLWKTVKSFAEAFGIDISFWGYSPPPPPEPQTKRVPRPKTVNKLIHHWYSNNRYENALIRTLLTVGFHTGVRPEELITIKVKDVFFDDGYIFIREQKKRYRERQIWIDDPILYSKKQNSLINWVTIWRPRRENGFSGDFLFIQDNGTPFPSEDALRMYLAPFVKSVWPHFSPKIMRDWSAIARLIRTKLETKKWDTRTVRVDLGHKKESTTENYTKYAERYFKKDSYDWLRAVLKFHPNSKRMRRLMKEDNGPSHEEKISSRILFNGQNTPQIRRPTGGENHGPGGVQRFFLLLKILTKRPIDRLIIRLHYLIKPFFSFFYNRIYFSNTVVFHGVNICN